MTFENDKDLLQNNSMNYTNFSNIIKLSVLVFIKKNENKKTFFLEEI